MSMVDFEGRTFEVQHVLDPNVTLVFIHGGALQGCAEIIDGRVVANICADGSSVVTARTVAEVAYRGRFGVA